MEGYLLCAMSVYFSVNLAGTLILRDLRPKSFYYHWLSRFCRYDSMALGIFSTFFAAILAVSLVLGALVGSVQAVIFAACLSGTALYFSLASYSESQKLETRYFEKFLSDYWNFL
jgi:hypothetical protein